VDISRDKVPKLETLKSLIVQLSEWKINQVFDSLFTMITLHLQFQLYMEHTFKYRGHETVWKDARFVLCIPVS
jgi:hexosaminidase